MGSIVGLTGALQQSQAQEGQAEFEADIAQQNINLAEQQVGSIGEAGSFQLHQQRLQQQALLSRAQVQAAGAGVSLGSGSILDFEVSAEEVFAEDRRQLQFDISNRQYEARIGAWNARLQKESAIARKENIVSQRAFIATGGAFDIATLGVKSTLSGFQAVNNSSGTLPNFSSGLGR